MYFCVLEKAATYFHIIRWICWIILHIHLTPYLSDSFSNWNILKVFVLETYGKNIWKDMYWLLFSNKFFRVYYLLFRNYINGKLKKKASSIDSVNCTHIQRLIEISESAPSPLIKQWTSNNSSNTMSFNLHYSRTCQRISVTNW